VPRTGGHSAYHLFNTPDRDALHTPRREIPGDCFSFGFIRNPWARMYSCYRKQSDVLEKYDGVSFKEYLLEKIQGNMIEHQALWFLDGCDYIARFENLQAEWDYILPIIGMEPRTLQHHNQVGIPDYHQHYDNEMIDYITEHHARDIEFGGYSFE
jgi:hypothetical protein